MGLQLTPSEHSYWQGELQIVVKDHFNGTASFSIYSNGNTVAYGSAACTMQKMARIAEAAATLLQSKISTP